MGEQAGKTTKRYRPNYFYSVLTISLVLYLLGTFCFLVLHANKLSNYFKENIIVSIEIKDLAKDADRLRLQKILDAEDFVKSTEYVSKELAAERLKKNIKEDFIELLGHNPLYNSIDLNIEANYANVDSINKIEESLLINNIVKTIHYDKQLIKTIDTKTESVGFVLLGLSIILLLITLTLINSTIRLSMYSQRFLIKSMQLVGATSFFIIKPFIFKSIWNGFVSGVIACLGLVLTINYAHQNLRDLTVLQDFPLQLIILAFVILAGIFISWFSTSFAVRKYLKLKLDDLY